MKTCCPLTLLPTFMRRRSCDSRKRHRRSCPGRIGGLADDSKLARSETPTTRSGEAMAIATRLTAAVLGFHGANDGWRKVVGGRDLTFRRVRARADFEQCERLQREVFGVSEHDLASFSI